ncbi:KamA family radical SAM protein [Candidatus Woesearchaeota archaeon]|nr:MAG: KamA family radical SAM protein [Candidatus Woesearchaeota archaeon]
MGWEKELANSITSPEELSSYLNLSPGEQRGIEEVVKLHPMRIPRYYLNLIDPKDPYDPIRKLIVPSIAELSTEGEYDTSGEQENTKGPGLQHKYAQTALVLATNQCAAYCRHCFRKRLVGLPNREILNRFDDAARYIEQHHEITNVLISGGDPFVLRTEVIRGFLSRLDTIPHLQFIRFGTRTPATFPQRITRDSSLTTLLKEYSRPDRRLYVITHFNHPRELTQEAREAAARIQDAGVLMYNQAVLLRGVNDSSVVLSDLLNKLVGSGITPYYVFQCRPVKRVKEQFQVPFSEGIPIIEGARARCSGPSKGFTFAMSHRLGKIQILGLRDDEIFFKFHEAKHPVDAGRFFSRRLLKGAGWLDDLTEESERSTNPLS